jgi:uroporphyrinogen-III synthase
VRVRDVVVYHTAPGPGAAALASGIQSGEFDAVVFTSPSTLRFASEAVEALRLRTGGPRIIICIGSTTGRAARELGLVPNGVAATQSVGGIVETLERCFATGLRAPALTTH